jgi:hypothetical protein
MKELKREDLIRLTQDLIRIPSVRREGEKEEKIALLLAHLLEALLLGLNLKLRTELIELLQIKKVHPNKRKHPRRSLLQVN